MIAAVDLGGGTIRLGLHDGNGWVERVRLPNTDQPADLDAAAAQLTRWRAAHGAPTRVGVAIPGIVTADSTGLASAHGKYAHLRGRDLRAWAAAAAGAPARVENDARAALLGEAAAGAAHGCRDAVLLIVGTGIGTAALVDGHLVRGAHGHGGVLGGHVTIDLAGAACPCGNLGCAETLGGSWALAGLAATRPDYGASPLASGPVGFREVIAAADAGDPCAAAVLDRALASWAAVLVTLIHLFDPERVVLAGGPLCSAPALVSGLRGRVASHLWSGIACPDLVVSPAPEESVLRGLIQLASRAEQEPAP